MPRKRKSKKERHSLYRQIRQGWKIFTISSLILGTIASVLAIWAFTTDHREKFVFIERNITKTSTITKTVTMTFGKNINLDMSSNASIKVDQAINVKMSLRNDGENTAIVDVLNFTFPIEAEVNMPNIIASTCSNLFWEAHNGTKKMLDCRGTYLGGNGTRITAILNLQISIEPSSHYDIPILITFRSRGFYDIIASTEKIVERIHINVI